MSPAWPCDLSRGFNISILPDGDTTVGDQATGRLSTEVTLRIDSTLNGRVCLFYSIFCDGIFRAFVSPSHPQFMSANFGRAPKHGCLVDAS